MESVSYTHLFSCNSDQIVLENDFFKYVISANGTNLKFIDKATGSDYLDSQADSKCAHILIDSVKYEAVSYTHLAF